MYARNMWFSNLPTSATKAAYASRWCCLRMASTGAAVGRPRLCAPYGVGGNGGEYGAGGGDEGGDNVGVHDG